MTSDLDILRTAQALIRQYGDEAEIHAAMRADELLEAGALDGNAAMMRVVRAIRELRRTQPKPGETVQ